MAAVRFFRLLVLGVAFAAAALTGSALAYVCHPAAPGTRRLTLSGAVRVATLHGSRADLLVAGHGGCSRVSWSTSTGVARTRTSACGVRQTASRPDGGARLGLDARGRQVIELGGRALPLPVFARSVTVDRNVALVDALRPDRGVFAVRLTDGAFTFLGPTGGSFRPQLGPRGSLFHDGESKRLLREGKTVVKFVPRRAIVRGFARTTAPIATGGPISAISMDGLRVAVAVRDRRGACDRVLYWNVAWPPVQRISAPSGPTCLPGARGTRIDTLAIGGFRSEWLASTGGAATLIGGSPLCQEWVVRRLRGDDRLTALAADGSTIAYATSGSVGVVTGSWRGRRIATGAGAPRALAADRTHVAILWPGGDVDVRTIGGTGIARLHAGGARALALEGTTLAVLRGAHLDVFDTRTGLRVHRLDAPASATGLDLQDGVAAFAVGRDAVVVDLRTGRTAVVGHASRPLLGVQIERPGLAYAWSTARSGLARFVPAIRIDAALGLAG